MRDDRQRLLDIQEAIAQIENTLCAGEMRLSVMN